MAVPKKRKSKSKKKYKNFLWNLKAYEQAKKALFKAKIIIKNLQKI